MRVCIAEKPSVAGEIAKVVGATSRKDGYYEGNNYQVTWTFGHLCTLKEPHDYLAEWKRWNLGTLPIIPSHFGIKLIQNKGVEKQFSVIEKLVQAATEVINCGDAGQEGEVIQRWVLQKAGCKVKIKRLWISSLTEEAIRDGFEKLYDNDKFNPLYAAGSSRAIGDWLLGINATRLYTIKYSQPGTVLSIGRVQTPTLALIVNRYLEIENFVPEPYWELKTVYKDVTFNSSQGKFSSKEEGSSALEKIKDKPFEITDFSRKPGKEAPPRLFDLTSLQVECNKKFALSADETLKGIQSLYEKKLTTYPRVDTTYLSNDIYPKIGGILKGLKQYQNLVEPLLQSKIRKSKKVFDDKKVTDHHAIIPTGVPAPDNLSRDEKLIYDTVTRRFIANFYPDCEISTTTILGKVEDVDFKTSGKQVIKENWRVVYKSMAGKKDTDDKILPEFIKGESGPHEPDFQEKETQPPKYYTEATLLRAMETAGKQVDDDELRELMKENGIGRPSTRANIIETLYKRKYIYKVRKNVLPTDMGVKLMEFISNDLLKSAELTGLWEKKLRQIETGEYEVKDFMAELKQMVSDIVFQVKNDYSKGKIVLEEEEKEKPEPKAAPKPKAAKELKCPRCGAGIMVKGNSAWGCSAYSSGCKTLIPFEFLEKKLTDKQIESLILKGKTPTVKGFSLDGKKVNGVVSFDDNFELRLEEEEKKPLLCPKCKTGQILKGNSAWGCSNYANGCRVIIPFEFLKKKLTDTHMEALVLKGKTSKLKGFSLSDNKNNVEGFIDWDENYNLRFNE
ncbi:type IA DNA topoisomerase [Plebeiibacterium sediminum]|uniref:DNA topoisomerase n=1 Tax=Plebeiibacterium sediminum TaxID=2992112 RepID=A0AAE3M4E4_9BACT|nr:type IA DNA topoisomerase [Plebeiobacterium sediminum]MCW3786934.1 DNA topoisomerase 3 [Plebeiobacterium sediminum]